MKTILKFAHRNHQYEYTFRLSWFITGRCVQYSDIHPVSLETRSPAGIQSLSASLPCNNNKKLKPPSKKNIYFVHLNCSHPPPLPFGQWCGSGQWTHNSMNTDPEPDPVWIQVNKITKLISKYLSKVKKKYLQVCT